MRFHPITLLSPDEFRIPFHFRYSSHRITIHSYKKQCLYDMKNRKFTCLPCLFMLLYVLICTLRYANPPALLDNNTLTLNAQNCFRNSHSENFIAMRSMIAWPCGSSELTYMVDWCVSIFNTHFCTIGMFWLPSHLATKNSNLYFMSAYVQFLVFWKCLVGHVRAIL